MKNFELTLAGFDGGSDETDDLVIWVAAKSEKDVHDFIASFPTPGAIELAQELPEGFTKRDGVEFNLHEDAEMLTKRCLILLEKHAPVAGMKG